MRRVHIAALAIVVGAAGACGGGDETSTNVEEPDAAPDTVVADASEPDAVAEDTTVDTSIEDTAVVDASDAEVSADAFDGGGDATVDTALDVADASDAVDASDAFDAADAADTADTSPVDATDAAPVVTTCGPSGATTGWVDTISIASAPVSGSETAVWIGTGLFVYDGGTFSKTRRGAIWSRSTHTWKAISITGAPQSIAGFGLAWTGSRVVLWGGRTTAGTVNVVSSGYLYDPATDSWSAMTATSPPAARELPTMQWNGSRVVVWGGSTETVASPSYFLTDGGMWDPVANTWSAIPGVTASEPLPDRPGAGATWTSTGLFVAGRWGAGVAGYFDHWAPPATSWPAACSFPLPKIGNQFGSVVWTGTEAIWWGGLANSGPTTYTDSYFGVGFRDTPGSCTVTSVPTATNAPSARARHTAVWTGTRMIVFGGRNASTIFGDGASYDPATGTWAPLEAGTPGARAGHQAFWSGTEMIVWGGGGGSDRAGCVYRP